MKASGTHDLKTLDYSIVQQCMHCGLCLPACPTYDATLRESASPRGRIAMMRAIADNQMNVSRRFAEEMYFCLGCLACESACPAGVDYTHLFEMARAACEEADVLSKPKRNLIRTIVLKGLFVSRTRLRFLAGILRWYQKTGLQALVRNRGLLRLIPKVWRDLEPLIPAISSRFSQMGYVSPSPDNKMNKPQYRVALLAGCIQDLAFADVNRDTVEVLEANGCEVFIPEDQQCCGSLHAHNGEWEFSKNLAKRNIDAFDLDHLDAIIINAAGCGSHLRHYDRLLKNDPVYFERAQKWSRKVRDVSEYLVEIGFLPPLSGRGDPKIRLVYHDACHLIHGQKIFSQPRVILKTLNDYELVDLPESSWCCGSAGIYNITQPEMAEKLLERKLGHIFSTQAEIVATANPGCLIQIVAGLKARGKAIRVVHPVSLLAEAYRYDKIRNQTPSDDNPQRSSCSS